MPERLYPNANFRTQGVDELHKIIDAIARNYYINFIHHRRIALDCLQKCAARLPNRIATLLRVGYQKVNRPLLKTNLSNVVIVLGDFLFGVAVEFQKQISVRLIVGELSA